MSLNWDVTAPVPFFSFLVKLKIVFPQFILGLWRIILFDPCIFKKKKRLFLFEWLFGWV